MAHIHSLYDTDPHFKIDPVTRAIQNDSLEKTALIQYDHNSERFTFELPRYIDGHDMSLCNLVQAHYINIDANAEVQNPGVYNIDDLQLSPADDTVVVCSWLISQNATQLVGTLNFAIRFTCMTGDNIDYAWNTGIHSGILVSSGINNGDVIVKEYADILEQWAKGIYSSLEDVLDLVNNGTFDALKTPAFSVSGMNITAVEHSKAGAVAISGGAISLGTNTIAGAFGFQIESFTSNDDESVSFALAGYNEFCKKNSGYEVGDICYIYHPDGNATGTIIEIDGYVVKVAIQSASTSTANQNVFYVPDKLEVGNVDIGVNATAIGDGTRATAKGSYAEGAGTITSSENQHVQGRFNIKDSDPNIAHVVGNGVDDEHRSNAHTLDWDGNAWFAGKVSMGDVDITDDNDLTPKRYVDDLLSKAGGGGSSGDANDNAVFKKSIIINDGVVSGEHTIAGGVTDKDFIEGLLGQLAGNLVTLNPSEAVGSLSISLGADNKTLSSASLAMGYDNLSGCKGYYFDTIDFESKTIKLSTTRRGSSLISPSYPDSVGWQKGDTLFIVNDDRYFLKIASVSGNTIEVESLPFSSIGYSATATVFVYSKPNDRTIINLTRPTDGIVTLGWGAFGIGAQNVVAGSNAWALGYKNIVAGDFGAAFGQENEVGYTGFAAGIANKAKGKAAFSSGDNTEANAFASSSAGYRTISDSNAQHVQGRYNIPDKKEKYAHIIGNGTSEENRSNAYTLDWGGNAWFAGLMSAGDGVICGTQGGKYTTTTVYGFAAIQHAAKGSPYANIDPKLIVLTAKAKDTSDKSSAMLIYDNRANIGLRITNNLTSSGGMKVEFVSDAIWTKASEPVFNGYIMINNWAEEGLTKTGVFKTPSSNAAYDTYYTVIY